MFNIIAKISALLLLSQTQNTLAQNCFVASEVDNSFNPEHMPDLMGQPSTDIFTQQLNTASDVSNPYINKQVTCTLTPTAKTNIDKVQFISLDTVPNNKSTYFKYIKHQLKIPDSSGVEYKYCNPHCDETMVGALGINNQGIPTFKDITVNFDPGLLCTGAGYEPYLIASIQQAIAIATANSQQGKITITTYSIGGSYNTPEKINLMRNLTEIPNSFVVTVIGNNLEQYDNCASNFFINTPKLFIVGGTQNGNQLSRYSMIGSCVKYYAPAKYISPLSKKLMEGVSFAGPIVAFLIANFKLNYPEATREQIDQHLMSLTDVVNTVSVLKANVTMHVFRKDSVCNIGTLPPVPTPSPTPAPIPCPPSTLSIPDFNGTTSLKWFTNTINACQNFCISLDVFKNKANTQATIAFRDQNNKVSATTTLSPTRLQTLYTFNASRAVGSNTLSIRGIQANQTQDIQLKGDIKQIGLKGDKVSFKNIRNC